MSSHLRTMRREARAQAKARNQPATPRKAHSRAVQAAVKEMRAKLYSKRATTSNKKSSKRKTRAPKAQNRGHTNTIHLSDMSQEPIQERPPLRHHPP